jgi:hypothetical protein
VPAPVVKALGDFLAAQLNVSVWDGEIPRYDTSGNPINPDSTVLPADWPVVKVNYKEPGFTREWTFEDPYTDTGTVMIQLWGTSRTQVETLMDGVEALLAQASNWVAGGPIALGGPDSNPNYIIHLLLERWWCGQEEGVRTDKSELLYRADMSYEMMIHGVVSTF